ncbi:MAG: hypothetical protein KAH17_04355 [Bacteroidales bacterium]|nr:hypothetical protein [Bacteroidales bacterium]
MKRIRHIFFVLLILLGGQIIWSCERIESQSDAGNGDEMKIVASDRLVILDSISWVFAEQTGAFAYFEKLSQDPLPSKGDLIIYNSKSFSAFGKLISLNSQNGLTGLEIEQAPLNDFYNFFAYRDTFRSTGDKFQTVLDSSVILKGDTLVLRDTELIIKNGVLVDGIVRIDSLEIYEIAEGEVFFYLTPEWQNGTITRDARIQWNQNLTMRGGLNYYASDGEELIDSILVRTRIFPGGIQGFPIDFEVQDWLVFEWHMPGSGSISCNFDLSGESNFKADFESSGYWDITSDNNYTSKELQLEGWNYLESGFINLIIKTVCMPVFCGLSDIQVEKTLELSVSAIADWPLWQMTGAINYASEIVSGSVLFRDMPNQAFYSIPGSVLLFDESGELVNEPPIAVLSISPSTGYTDTEFKLNASASNDLEDSQSSLEVRWDFDGDDVWDTPFSTTKLIKHLYLFSGSYTIKIEVRDSHGASSTTSKSIIVHETSSAPIATFSISPETGRQADFFTFDASGCYDAEDPLALLEVRWDFQNDGEWDTHYSTTKAAVWVYGVSGNFVVKLEVRDSDGLTGSTTKLLSVTDANIKPEASFTVNPESGTTETIFYFDASECSDAEDILDDLQVRWDWSNDGVWDTEYRTIKNINHQFSSAGNYSVILEVIDTDGYSNTSSRIIQVANPNTPPTAYFTADPKSGTINTKFIFDASGSTDLEDVSDALEVRWDWNNDNIFDTEFTTDKTIFKQFSETGTFIIKVQVRDSGGLTNTKADLIYVN